MARDSREKILLAAFEEITRHGYQGAGIADIIARSGLSRGAVYHHFESKQAVAIGVVDEVIMERYRQYWARIFEGRGDVLHALMDGLRNPKLLNCNNGCSLANLHQDAGRDEGRELARAVTKAQKEFEGIFAAALERARDNGELRNDADPISLGAFVAASFQGIMGAAATAGGSAKYSQAVDHLENYLRSYAAGTKQRRSRKAG